MDPMKAFTLAKTEGCILRAFAPVRLSKNLTLRKQYENQILLEFFLLMTT